MTGTEKNACEREIMRADENPSKFDFLKERDQTLDEVRHAYDLAMSGDDASAVEFGISAGERLGEILRQAQR